MHFMVTISLNETAERVYCTTVEILLSTIQIVINSGKQMHASYVPLPQLQQHVVVQDKNTVHTTYPNTLHLHTRYCRGHSSGGTPTV
jgi:hypothetical protein